METHQIILVACAVVGVVLTLCGIAVKWILAEIKNSEDRRNAHAEMIMDGQSTIRSNVDKIAQSHEKRIEKLEIKSADFRSGSAIDHAIEHARGNADTKFQSVTKDMDRHQAAIDVLKEKVIKLETNHEQTSKSIGKLENELKETRSEINHRFDLMAEQNKVLAEQQTAQTKVLFDQVCVSIREIRDARPR